MTVAVILAGGLGTRLRSAIPDLPKPLAPIHGRPFLEYLIDYWISQGIDRFVLSIGYLHEKIIGHFGDTYCGAKLEYVIENTPLGTGGGLLAASESIKNSESFLLLNGDTFFAVDFQKLDQFSRNNNADWCFSLFRTSNTERYMGLKMNHDSRITHLGIKAHAGTCLANGGVYWVRTASVRDDLFLKRFPVGINASLESDLFNYELRKGGRMYGLESHGDFLDIGIPEDYKTSFSFFQNNK